MNRPAVAAFALACVWSLSAVAQQRTPPRPAPAPGAKPAAPVAKPAAPAAPRAERAVPFRVGETLTFDVSWSAYVTAGTVVSTVK